MQEQVKLNTLKIIPYVLSKGGLYLGDELFKNKS